MAALNFIRFLVSYVPRESNRVTQCLVVGVLVMTLSAGRARHGA